MKKMKLNIQLFGGSVSINGVSETVNQSANTSSFNITATMSTTGTTHNYDNADMEVQYKLVSDNTWHGLGLQTFGIGKSSSVTKSWDLNDVTHNNDGTLEDIQFRVNWYITSSTWGTTGITTYTPTSIPRGSKFDTSIWGTTQRDTPRQITSSLSFPVIQYLSGVYHKLEARYVDSGTEYIIATRTGVNINNGYISFAFTNNEINSVGSLMSFDTHYIRMYLYTYTDSAYQNQLGDVSIIWWNGYVPNYSLQWGTQTVTDSVSTYDSYKPNVNTFIAGLSKPTLTFSASSTDATHGTYGKTISYAVNGTTATSPYTDDNLTNTTSYTVTANDGRATQISWSPTLTIIPYTLPNIPSASVKVTRPVPTVGEVEVSYTANYYDGTGLTNLSNATYNFYYKENESDSWGNPVNQLSGSGTSGTVTFTDVSVTGLDYKKPFYFKIELTDRMGIAATTYIGSIPKGEPVWNAYTDSNDENVFNVNGKAIVKDDLNVSGNVSGSQLKAGNLTLSSKTSLLNLIYPVGSIYMSVNNVSPDTFLGGTWVALEDRFLIGASSTYSAGSTGGSTTHTLTVDEIPSHSHTIQDRLVVWDTPNLTALNNASYSGPMKLREANQGLTNTTGGGQAHSIMNPYLAVYMWKRTQ